MSQQLRISGEDSLAIDKRGAPSDRPLNGHAKCILCNDQPLEVLYEKCSDQLYDMTGQFDVMKCPSCGLGQTRPIPSFEELSEYYHSEYVSYREAEKGSDGSLYQLLRAVARVPYSVRYGTPRVYPIPKSGHNRLVDVGCGTGKYLAEMVRRGWTPLGIEPSEAASQVARTRLGLDQTRILCTRAEHARLPSDSFDLVTMSHVLEHLHAPINVLERIRDWLRPGGQVRIWVPNFGSMESRLFGRSWFGLDVPRHLHHFSEKSIRSMLSGAGFSGIRIVPQFQTMSLSGSVTLLLRSVFHARRGYKHSRELYYAALPLGALLLGLGSMSAMDVTAEKL